MPNFKETWASDGYGKVSVKSAIGDVRSLHAARQRFAAGCEAAKADILGNRPSKRPRWYVKFDDGSYVITLRAGIVVIDSGKGGQTHCEDIDAATKFLTDAAQAGLEGIFDEELKAARKKMAPSPERSAQRIARLRTTLAAKKARLNGIGEEVP